MADHVLAYTAGQLDRASDRRTDPAWLAERLADTASRVLPMWRDDCFVRAGLPLWMPSDDAKPVAEAADQLTFLGLEGSAGVFTADLSTLGQDTALALTGADVTENIRVMTPSVPSPEATTLAYARGILHWNRNQRFCGTCGSLTNSDQGGHVRTCTGEGCGRLLFPRIEPAIIVVVEAPEPPARCLLGLHKRSTYNKYSTLAGFVEIGESIEDSVRREVSEEAGVEVASVTYQGSQAWPFPAGLMLGFRAVAANERIAVDEDELVDARWFTPAEVREMLAEEERAGVARKDSIGAALLDGWLADNPA